MNLELLEDFAEYEGTEVGETVRSLLFLWDSRDYLSDKFVLALKNELQETSDDVSANWIRKDEEITLTRRCVTWESVQN